MRFAKMHGAGNDYVVIDARKESRDWGALAQKMSDRHFGVGSDGIILVLPSSHAHLQMRMFDPDGSEAEMCGNGIRCLAKFALEREIVTLGSDQHLQVETMAGVRTVVPVRIGSKVVRARVNMGMPRFKPEEIPVNVAQRVRRIGDLGATGHRTGASGGTEFFFPREEMALDWPMIVDGQGFQITCLSMGNPHAVAFLEEDVENVDLAQIGPVVEHHPMFPRRVNFEIVNVVDRQHLRARVWERGVGETLACGTGACAIAVASSLHGYTGDKVDITLKGGVLAVEWDGRGEVWMEGPVEEVFESQWPDRVREVRS
ncbi:MAG: diaminopimelate epimerase [Chloroflexi bacterium]|nr:diaminopimelate epimerase [Chloroflexota bacterium]